MIENPLGICAGGVAGSYGSVMASFLRNHQTDIRVVVASCNPPNVKERVPLYLYQQAQLQVDQGTPCKTRHSSLIYNSQKLERTQMSLSGGMDTENVVYLHNGILPSN